MRIAGGKQIPLSVQELVDCDTAMNKGCNGGNPLYAFEYTMTNALTSWEDYPYRETVSQTVRLLSNFHHTIKIRDSLLDK